MSSWPLRTWLIAGGLCLLLAAALGFAVGSGSAKDGSDAEQAREEGYEATYESTLRRVEAVSRAEGLKAGRTRGAVAGEKTGLREGFDIGGGFAGIQTAKDSAEAAVAAQAAAEAELADRQANCGSIPRAPDVCPTTSELESYQAAVVAARQARQGAANARE